MKNIIIIFILLLSQSILAGSLIISNVKVKINNNCQIEATDQNNKVKLLDLGLKGNECDFIKHTDTNIIHIERVSNSYMLLVESTETNNNRCISTYTGVVIKNDGEIIPSKIFKRSGSCNIDRERKAFDYFAYKMKIYK